MPRNLILLALVLVLTSTAFSQKEKDKDKDKVVLTGKEAEDFLKNIGIDSSFFLKQATSRACSCIDSVKDAETDKNKELEGFSACIDKVVIVYQMMLQMSNASKSPDKAINIAVDKESGFYRKHYFQIESELMDSCNSLKQAIASNDEARQNSYSDNPDAMKIYFEGVEFLKKEKYAEGITYFEKAVALDPEFAFAWDNLGICYRRTGKLDKAEAAYKSSLKADPSGKTALQNLAVVYQMQKRDDEAISTYKQIVRYYPDDPEVYYGIGMVYFNNKKDWENALDNMCKAYKIYVEQKSPYRSDAEKLISLIYAEMKKENKEDKFNKILKDHNIRTN